MGKLRDKALVRISEYNKSAVVKVPITDEIVSSVKSIIARLSYIEAYEDKFFRPSVVMKDAENAVIEVGKLKAHIDNEETSINKITLYGPTEKDKFEIKSEALASRIIDILKAEFDGHDAPVTKKGGNPKNKFIEETRRQCLPYIASLESENVDDEFLAYLFDLELETYQRKIREYRT